MEALGRLVFTGRRQTANSGLNSAQSILEYGKGRLYSKVEHLGRWREPVAAKQEEEEEEEEELVSGRCALPSPTSCHHHLHQQSSATPSRSDIIAFSQIDEGNLLTNKIIDS